MKIYLLDMNKNMTDAWKKYFASEPNVCIVNDNFENFMNTHPEIDAIVSPANSFGLMDGGYDKAITDYFGKQLMEDVQKIIIEDWFGEQPVGTSFSVRIRNSIDKYYNLAKNENGTYAIRSLIHTPTMRTPERIKDARIIYQCMRTTLIEAIRIGSHNIVIPAFGGATGGVDFEAIAKMMKVAYEQVLNSPENISWEYAIETKMKLKKFLKDN